MSLLGFELGPSVEHVCSERKLCKWLQGSSSWWGRRESWLKKIWVTIESTRGFPGVSAIMNLPANAGNAGSIPGSGRSPGEEVATHSSTLAPWTEEPGRLKSMGPQKSQTKLSN